MRLARPPFCRFRNGCIQDPCVALTLVVLFFSTMAASFVLVNEAQLAVKATLSALNFDKDTIERVINSFALA